ncbi:MAG: HAMP domain-containing histidine kinase [Planctomycetia bacterium]|nr:HAMP domain-containing histidine kinase [Planctomycetia bacterium]
MDDRLLALLQKALGHELPNQLIAVQGLARLLDAEARDRLGDDGRDYVQRLSAAAQRAHEMTRSLADLIRALRAPRSALRVPVAEVLREAAQETQVLFPACRIDHHFPQHGPFLTVPATVLRQLALQLLRHACQAASPHGGAVAVGAREAAGEVAFWVCAGGPPLSVQQQQQLFEPFACREQAGAGCGLGPLLARQIVDSWGGQLGVQSEAARGTTFRVGFPLGVGREQEHA